MRGHLWILAALATGIFILVLARIAAYAADQPMSVFTRDVQQTAGFQWYTGSVSALNLMVWAAVAALSLFVAWLIPAARHRQLALGGFALVLAADDALMFHETEAYGSGVAEWLFLALYAVVALLLSWWIVRDAGLEVVVAFLSGAALLGLSVVVDQVITGSYVVEDGAKLLGSLVWLTVPLIECQLWKAGLPRDDDDARASDGLSVATAERASRR